MPPHLKCSFPFTPCAARYEDDRDEGEWFLYTGSGGRDLSGNKRTSKVGERGPPGVGLRRGRALSMSPGHGQGSQSQCGAPSLAVDACSRRTCCRGGRLHRVQGLKSESPLASSPSPSQAILFPQVQSFDQTFDNMNKALKLSCTKGLPVRVVRSYKVGWRGVEVGLWECFLGSFDWPNLTHEARRDSGSPKPTLTIRLNPCASPSSVAGEALGVRPRGGDPRAVRRRVPHRPLLAQAGRAGPPHVPLPLHALRQ